MNTRIEKIAGMVKEGVIVADIGTDHAFLPILLVKEGKVPKAYACDVSKGPLEAAAKNIRREGVKVQTILSDGFQNVPMDTECAVIAGMGCITATSILDNALDRLGILKQIIVEVNRDTDRMRRWISDHGFTINDEILIQDRGFDYIAIDFDCRPHSPYSEREILLGPRLLEKNEECFIEYCTRQRQKIEMIMAKCRPDDPRIEALTKKRDLWSLE